MGQSKELQQRTITQNKALHKYFELLAQELNTAGLDMKTVLKPSIDISWTKENVKEYLWKPIQQAMYQKLSTTEMNSKEPSEVYEVLNRHLGEKFGVYVVFPTNEPPMLDYLQDNNQ